MPVVEYDILAQPYSPSGEELADFLFPVRTTAQLADIADPINTENKRVGRMVWNSTTGVPVWADAATPGGTWSDSAGNVDHTPS